MKCNECPAFGYDFISRLCVLSHDISRGCCNRKADAIGKELDKFLKTDSRAIDGYYTLPRYVAAEEGET